MRRLALLGVVTGAALTPPALGALASLTPAVTLDQSAGTTAGSFANLGP